MRQSLGKRRVVVAMAMASLFAVLGGTLPAVTAAAATAARGGCMRTTRTGGDALQPRDVAGACITSSAARASSPGRPTRIEADVCVPVTAANDRCPQWLTKVGYTGFPILVPSPGSDGRLYQLTGVGGLDVTAFDHGGNRLWTNVRRGVTYTSTGSTRPDSEVRPIAGATSPDGAVLYVTAVMRVGAPAQPECGWEGLLVAYRTATGEPMWAANDDAVSQACSEFWTSMAVDSNHVYVTGGSTVPPSAESGETAAYDASNGTRLWWTSNPQLRFDGGQPPDNGYGGVNPYLNPVIRESVDGRTIMVVSYVVLPDDHLVKREYEQATALTSAAGAERWTWRIELCPTCSPTTSHDGPALAAAVDDNHLYFGTDVFTEQLPNPEYPSGTTYTEERGLVALDLRTGHPVWTVDLGMGLSSYTVPWIATDATTSMVYVFDDDDWGPDPYILAAYRSMDGSQAWSADMTALTLGGAPSGEGSLETSLAVSGTQIFLAATVVPVYTQQGEVVAVDAGTGSASWRAWLAPSAADLGDVGFEIEPMTITAGDGLVTVAANENLAGSSCSSSGTCGSYGLWAYSAS